MNVLALIVIASLVGGLPIVCILLVALASRREDAARSMAGRAPGPLTRMARRLLGFHAVGISRPACRTRAPSRGRRNDRRGARRGVRRDGRPWSTRSPADDVPDDHPFGGFPDGGFLSGGTTPAGHAARDDRTVRTAARAREDAMALAGQARPHH